MTANESRSQVSFNIIKPKPLSNSFIKSKKIDKYAIYLQFK